MAPIFDVSIFLTGWTSFKKEKGTRLIWEEGEGTAVCL